MAQLTTEITLTTSWQEITDVGFVGQKDASSAIEICNADSTPSGDVAAHIISEGTNLRFPEPATGSWYIRIGDSDSSPSSFIYSEV